jgi:hypothetical protein
MDTDFATWSEGGVIFVGRYTPELCDGMPSLATGTADEVLDLAHELKASDPTESIWPGGVRILPSAAGAFSD